MAHRIAYELMRGPIPSRMLVLHKCDTPSCVNPSHLFLGTVDDNNKDRARKNRSHRPCKLTLEQCRQIQALYFAGDMSQSEIALQFGVQQTHISRIVRGQRSDLEPVVSVSPWHKKSAQDVAASRGRELKGSRDRPRARRQVKGKKGEKGKGKGA